MKTTKLLLTAALVGAASLSAHAGVHFGFSFGLPLPPLPVVVVDRPAPVYVTPAAPVYVSAPAPVYVAPPACPAPAVVVTTPACPGPDYAWTPGYWSGYGHSRVYVAGCWNYRPATVLHYARAAHADRDWAGRDAYYNDRDARNHDGYRR